MSSDSCVPFLRPSLHFTDLSDQASHFIVQMNKMVKLVLGLILCLFCLLPLVHVSVLNKNLNEKTKNLNDATLADLDICLLIFTIL